MKKIILALCLSIASFGAMADTCISAAGDTTPTKMMNGWQISDSSPPVSITLNGVILYNGPWITTFTYNNIVYYQGSTIIYTYGGNGKNGSGAYKRYQLCSSGPTYAYTTTQDQGVGCPADRPSGYILQRRSYEVWSDGSARNFGGWYNVADYCSAVVSYTATQDQGVGCPANRPSGYVLQRRTYEVWTDGTVRNYGAWYNVADYCSAVYSYTGYNYTTGACPSTQPSGLVNMRQSYEVWSDGSIKNYSAWAAISNTCVAAYQSTETRYQTLACPTTYPNGAGLKQSSTRQIWSDGARAWSAWGTVEFSCSKTVADVKDNSRKTCGEGQTGYRITEWRRNHVEYISQSTLTPAQLAIENEKNATTWAEVEVANTCLNVADKVTTEPGTRTLSCSSVYGGSESDYTGEVIETGTKVYSYSSVTKQTTTSFVSNKQPSYSSTCKSSIKDVVIENSTKACPSGYTGTVTSYRYVATDSKGIKSYPNGVDFIESSNNCVSTGASIDDSGVISNAVKSKGLLANSTIKTSSLSTKTDLDTFIKTLDKTTVSKQETYKLHLIVDDLSTGKYNKANVIKTVTAFKSATGQEPIITVPQNLDKYIGNGGITATNYKTKVLKSAVLNNSQVTVTYSELSRGLKEGGTSSFTVDLL
jgi:hypothetical protein